ncbi:MAG: HAD-IC family P-type ATPase [Gammaproteobacteria bacterium]|jgi:Ca2+-transporting ATPase|nr:HAD-IC family P-type ATPase [Gammaproteobacteria bacterium]MDH4005037.1 HAD-IC family P-type ATPase [Gammaproteobacteria bacterium]NCF59073.1 HAD-IC family P-type ATPase [Gammaproteobacteria bacterium]
MNRPHPVEPWHRKDAATILRSLGTSPDFGLSERDARVKLEEIGANEIERQRGPGVLRLFGHQFADVMIVLLIAAAIIAGWLGDVIDTVAIVVIVLLNATVGVIQEYRAQRAIAALRRMSAPTARVLRDGNMSEIPARQVVPGDIVQIEAGDVVPADMRLISTVDLGADESALTGESVPVSKTDEVVDISAPALGERLNMAYKGTLVTRGRASGVVIATGRATEIGRIADLLRGARNARTPLQLRLARFSRRIALVVLAICAIVFATGMLQGQPALLMFMTALSLAVAAVPEALPAVITLSLGIGARRLGENSALVRRLPAVESLGSVTYICADKTGTLTENRMALSILYAAGGEHRDLSAPLPDLLGQRIGEVLALCNDVDARDLRGEPTEVALLEGARAMGFDKQVLSEGLPRVGELPFEAERRCMVTLHDGPDGPLALVKGAPERVIEGCVDQMTAQGRAAITGSLLEAADRMAERGYRVLALAFRDEFAGVGEIGEAELGKGWTFAGLAGLIDPPRPGALEAIRECRSAGIVPVMITGDHPATAEAIARELAIADESSESMTGSQLAALSDDEFEQHVERVRVYARVDPEQKIRIVRALQDRGHFVAMTGDGVNDAPALRAATIGVAMGQRGTDVAREAAELVLLDDSFATIVTAVNEGRRIFDDIRKFIRYTMTSNSGEIWVLVLAPLLGLPLPLLPLHILWINLVTDGLPGLALSAEPAERDVMQRRPRPPEESIFAHGMAGHILWVGLLIGGLTLATQAWTWTRGQAEWQTMVFTVLVVAQLFHCLAIRSERFSLFGIGLFSNPAVVIAILITVAAQIAVIYLPFFNTVFRTVPLSATQLAACFAIGSVVLVAVELEKFVRRRAEG